MTIRNIAFATNWISLSTTNWKKIKTETKLAELKWTNTNKLVK